MSGYGSGAHVADFVKMYTLAWVLVHRFWVFGCHLYRMYIMYTGFCQKFAVYKMYKEYFRYLICTCGLDLQEVIHTCMEVYRMYTMYRSCDFKLFFLHIRVGVL